MKKIQEDIAKMVEDLGRSKMVVDKYLTSSTNAEKLKKDIDEIVQRIVELKKKGIHFHRKPFSLNIESTLIHVDNLSL